jgi:hypothetical protein
MLYLDTSALLKSHIREPGSEAVHGKVVSQDLPLAIREIQEAELINALQQKVFSKEITPERAAEQITLLQDVGNVASAISRKSTAASASKLPASAAAPWTSSTSPAPWKLEPPLFWRLTRGRRSLRDSRGLQFRIWSEIEEEAGRVNAKPS